MESRTEYPQDRQPCHIVLFRPCAAAGIVIAVLAVAALLPKGSAPGAGVAAESGDAAAATIAVPPAQVPEHIRESAGGVDPLHPHEYLGQPSVF